MDGGCVERGPFKGPRGGVDEGSLRTTTRQLPTAMCRMLPPVLHAVEPVNKNIKLTQISREMLWTIKRLTGVGICLIISQNQEAGEKQLVFFVFKSQPHPLENCRP